MIGTSARSPRFQRRAPPKATRPSARNMLRLLVQEAGEEDPARLEGEEPGGDTAARAPGQLVDGRGEQDEPRDRDPDLGDAKDELGRVERPELDREHELVETRRPSRRSSPTTPNGECAIRLASLHEEDLVAAPQLGGDRGQRDAGRGQHAGGRRRSRSGSRSPAPDGCEPRKRTSA